MAEDAAVISFEFMPESSSVRPVMITFWSGLLKVSSPDAANSVRLLCEKARYCNYFDSGNPDDRADTGNDRRMKQTYFGATDTEIICDLKHTTHAEDDDCC